MDNLKIEYEALDSILDKLAEIINIYMGPIQEDSADLVSLNYYKEGQADEIFDIYGKILDKLMEVADTYYLAYRLTEKIKSNMMTLDQLIASVIVNLQLAG